MLGRGSNLAVSRIQLSFITIGNRNFKRHFSANPAGAQPPETPLDTPVGLARVVRVVDWRRPHPTPPLGRPETSAGVPRTASQGATIRLERVDVGGEVRNIPRKGRGARRQPQTLQDFSGRVRRVD